MKEVCENYRRLLDRIGEASVRSGRNADAVRLIGVTKRVAAERVREAIEAGLREIGENRVQEAEEKFALIEDLEVRRHLIGRLQSNKVRKALGLFSVIQTVDSEQLVRRLDRLSISPLRILVQVKLSPEEGKAGVEERALQGVIETARLLPKIDVRGLMAIPPFVADVESTRRHFAKLQNLAEKYGLTETSMGMSHDFEIAIEEGATMVRVGTALFGNRL